mmetsp:Transcript_42413/g.55930  ORF Transcript_42413/g.55930 Transcript_42413/m.55930 type:complete len:103 (+) Transcript_42413:384-692(+)
MANYDTGELYYAYLLRIENGASLSEKTQKDFEKRLADKAVDEWLSNFDPTKWVLKEHIQATDSEGDSFERIVERSLDSQLLQMAEMVASLIPNKKVKKQAKD